MCVYINPGNHGLKDPWPQVTVGEVGDPVAFRKNRGKYGEVDRSPTKAFMEKHREDPRFKKLFKLAFEKRPYEELYDLRTDPGQLNNIAAKPEYAKQKRKLVPIFEKEFGATYDSAAPGIPPRPKM